jgi:hypothetical protein
MFAWAFLGAIAVATAAQADAPDRYQVGQVWEYRTRPQDSGSLLRIQKIEAEPGSASHTKIYHISVVGVHFQQAGFNGELAHLPVSRETLDASVTHLSSASATFPDAEPGIADWRSAEGGVFTIPLAEVVGWIEQMVHQRPSTQESR